MELKGKEMKEVQYGETSKVDLHESAERAQKITLEKMASEKKEEQTEQKEGKNESLENKE